MDVREKLVELLNNSFAEQYEKRGLLTAPHTAEDLIAHGVTVTDNNAGKWISVKDRLPEKEGWYLCVVRIGKSGAVYVRVMNGDKYGFGIGHIYSDDVTHWMPLPDAPKGE